MSTVEIVEADSTAHDLAELNVRVAQWAFQKPGEAMCADSKTVCTGLTQHRGVEGHSFNCSPTLAVRLAEQPFRPIEDKTAMFGDLKHGAVLDHHFSWDKSASRPMQTWPCENDMSTDAPTSRGPKPDDTRNELREAAQEWLQRQNDRLKLLLNLTNRITSNLEIREVLRAISTSIRELMQCDAVAISWPDAEGNLVVHTLEAPQFEGFLKEGWVVPPAVARPAVRVLETLTPFVVNAADPDEFGREASAKALADGFRSHVFLPLVNRGRALGVLGIARKTDASFRAEDVEFLSQVCGQIAIAVENALAYQEISELKDKLAQEKLYLEEEIRSEMNFENIVGNSPVLKQVLELVETVAPNDSTVLLLGETGTGKELIARAIHERSRRKERTFVKLNCAAIPTGLLESELFGHEKGAFTGAITQKMGRLELADQGTLFLDEVGDIPIEIQPKLLRVLQEREFERLGSTHTRKVNVRLVAATNRDLGKMIAAREFRSDLYYRLNVFPIRIPPLRERREDIPLLVSYFVQKFAKQMQKKIEGVPAAAMKSLTAWEWPGNIRELENFIERAVILTRGKSLEAPLAELRRWKTDEPTNAPAPQDQENIARIVKETINALDGKKGVAEEYAKQQREQIVRALTESKGQVGGADGAAARMSVNRTTLLSRMKKFGIVASCWSDIDSTPLSSNSPLKIQ